MSEWREGSYTFKPQWHFLQRLYERYDGTVLGPHEYEMMVAQIREGRALLVEKGIDGGATSKYYVRVPSTGKLVKALFNHPKQEFITALENNRGWLQLSKRKHKGSKSLNRIKRERGQRRAADDEGWSTH
jgi:hypothetical protein